jgi:hypothetical protein
MGEKFCKDVTSKTWRWPDQFAEKEAYLVHINRKSSQQSGRRITHTPASLADPAEVDLHRSVN